MAHTPTVLPTKEATQENQTALRTIGIIYRVTNRATFYIREDTQGMGPTYTSNMHPIKVGGRRWLLRDMSEVGALAV